ncbi:hypothetical protein [Clostridium aciditolerans]|uniref:Uncharacterized protein n=1 Tax=Clostridium aciditolerans TaxID=339861 RepID=A0A934HTP6_9CLOT|nr:hypothetical protein [Clostridium aciditolerans]MBI6873108.1 hypothetical protein [Clostridium aciditolerans]
MTAVGLLLIGILLIALNINAIRKEKRTFSNVLEHSENSMKDYDLEIGKLRKEFAETVLELQREIEDLKADRELSENDIYIEDNHRSDNKEKIEDNYKNEDYALNKMDVEYENISGSNDVINSIDVNENNTFVNYLIDDSTPINGIDENNTEEENINKNNEAYQKKGSSVKRNNVKVDEISKLLDEGLSVDEISEKIGIGKGEVLLIKELYIK